MWAHRDTPRIDETKRENDKWGIAQKSPQNLPRERYISRPTPPYFPPEAGQTRDEITRLRNHVRPKLADASQRRDIDESQRRLSWVVTTLQITGDAAYYATDVRGWRVHNVVACARSCSSTRIAACVRRRTRVPLCGRSYIRIHRNRLANYWI